MTNIQRILGGVGAGLLAMTLAWAPVSISLAAEFVAPDQAGNVTISATETKRNLYTAGGDVLVNSTTQGDLVVAGGSVTIEGSVEGDLMIAGGSVNVNGPVGGDIRLAGGDVAINNTVGGDLVIAGGSVVVNERATVGGDLIVASGDVRVLSPIAGKLSVYSGTVLVNSAITGAVMINAGEKLTVGERAVFGQDAKYKSWQEAEIREGAQTGGLQYEKVERRQDGGRGEGLAGILTFGFILQLLALILTALVLVRLFTRTAGELVNRYVSQVWSNLGIGFVAMIAMPIIAIILLITVVGFYAGLIMLFLWLALVMVATLLGMVSVGAWINMKLTNKNELSPDWQSVVIGVVLTVIVSLLPVIGWLFMALVIFTGFGTIIRHIGRLISSEQVPSAPVAVENN